MEPVNFMDCEAGMRLFRHWNIWVTLGGVLLAFMIISFAVILNSISPVHVSGEQSSLTYGMTVLPAKTFTPTSTEQFELPSATPTAPFVDGLRPGMYVQIIGTGGSGLRIRASAGLSSTVKFFGLDDEVFFVKDGPVEQDGYTWWLLVAPYDESRNGWAASDFLTVVEQQP
jgi:hypothetical protein